MFLLGLVGGVLLVIVANKVIETIKAFAEQAHEDNTPPHV